MKIQIEQVLHTWRFEFETFKSQSEKQKDIIMLLCSVVWLVLVLSGEKYLVICMLENCLLTSRKAV